MVDRVGSKGQTNEMLGPKKPKPTSSTSAGVASSSVGYKVLEKKLKKILLKASSDSDQNQLLVAGFVEYLCDVELIALRDRAVILDILLNRLNHYPEVQKVFDDIRKNLASKDQI